MEMRIVTDETTAARLVYGVSTLLLEVSGLTPTYSAGTVPTDLPAVSGQWSRYNP